MTTTDKPALTLEETWVKYQTDAAVIVGDVPTVPLTELSSARVGRADREKPSALCLRRAPRRHAHGYKPLENLC